MEQALLDRIADNRSLSPWRLAYLKALQERIADFRAVGLLAEAATLEQKQTQCFESFVQKEASDNKAEIVSQKRRSWSLGQDFFERELQWVKRSLNDGRALIPRWELKELISRLEEISSSSEGRLDQSIGNLRDLREQLVDRFFRSNKAMAVQEHTFWKPAKKEGQTSIPEVVSHYNDSATLQRLLTNLGETDPIWVGDFIAFYDELMQTADLLKDLSTDKKKRS